MAGFDHGRVGKVRCIKKEATFLARYIEASKGWVIVQVTAAASLSARSAAGPQPLRRTLFERLLGSINRRDKRCDEHNNRRNFMANRIPHGIIAYPITPFEESGTGIDEPAFTKVIDALLDTDPAAVAILGSTGESAYLTDEEWEQAVEIGVRAVAGQVPLIVGIGALTTKAAVDKAKFAEQTGADRLMVIPVSYWKLTDAEVFAHFSAVAKATNLPIMAYNNPATSGVDMTPELLVRMVREIDNVDLVKESSGDLNRMHVLHELSHGNVPFYNGANHLALEALASGATGWCTAAPNILGRKPAQVLEHVAERRIVEARALFYEILPVLRFIVHGGLPTTIKAGLRLQGLEAGDPRKPLLPLTDDGIAELRSYLSV